MISLIHEASVGIWIVLYIAVHLIGFLFFRQGANQAIKQKDTSRKGITLVGSNILLRSVLAPAIFVFIIYKLISVGLPQESSFLTWLLFYAFLILPLFLLNKVQIQLLKRRLTTGKSPSFFPFLFLLIRIPFALVQNLAKWLFFAKLAGLPIESHFWSVVIAFILVVIYNSIEEAVVRRKKKP